MASQKLRLYPEISIKRIKNPSRFYAIPVLGILVKCFMVIPVVLYLFVLGIAAFFVWLITPFYILFTGKYWSVAYILNTGIIRLQAKMTFFLYGMTDTYPGFSFTIDDAFSIAIPYPKKPSKLFAIPLLGFLIRVVLLIPYAIYEIIINRAAIIALAVGSFYVVFTGTYPESDFEINRDAFRVAQAGTMWMTGLSDAYPSFWISMNHIVIKIVLIVVATLWTITMYSSNAFFPSQYRDSGYRQSMHNTQMPPHSPMYYNNQ